MEEFQHDWGNATFDDSATAVSAKFLLRLYVEKRDSKYKPALDKALAFVLDSQYPIGAWPQRFPLKNEFSHHGHPDYTSYLTFNDGVAGENIDFLVLCHQALGDAARAGCHHQGHERVPGHADGPAAARLGAAVHARPAAGSGPHLRAQGAGDAHHRRQHRAPDAVLSADGRHAVPGPHPRGARLAAGPGAAARGRAPAGRDAPDLRRSRHQPAALRAPAGLERRQRALLRGLQPRQDAGALQRLPPPRRGGPADAVPSSCGRCPGPRPPPARR